MLLIALARRVEWSTALWIAFGLLDLVPYTLFGVAWHRIVLLGGAEAPRMIPMWRRRHWRFLGYALTITLIGWTIAELYIALLLALSPGTMESAPAQIPGTVLLALITATWLVIYLTIRLSFVLPAVAVDERYGFAASWSHTRGQVMRLFYASFLMFLPLWLGFAVVFRMIAPFAPDLGTGSELATSMSATVVWLMLKYFMIALSVTLVSTAFRTCTGWVPAVSGLPAIPEEDRDTDIDESP